MRNRWFHRPLLHTEHHTPKRVTWLELFYDLIFVASIIQLGDALSDHVAHKQVWLGLGTFALHFVPLWIAWTGFTFYANRFDVDDFVHRALVLLQMAAVGCIGVSAPRAMAAEPDALPFALSVAAAHAVIAMMYVRAWKHTTEARDYSRYWGAVFAVAAALWGVSALLPDPWCELVWVIAMLVVVFAPTSRASRGLADLYPLDMEHLAERYGLLTIIVLGESFVKVLSYLAADAHGTEPEMLTKGLFNLVITSAVWWVYFDDVAGSHLKPGRNTWIVWLYGHLPLAMAVTAVGVAVKHDIKIDWLGVPPAPYRILLVTTLAATFASVALIDAVTQRGTTDLDERWRIAVRLGSAALLPLLGLAGGSMNGGTFLGLVTLLCVAQVAFDMAMAPLAGTTEEAVPTSELARRRRDGSTDVPVRSRWSASEAIRHGTPTGMRRDLYFWLMEGSWTRLVVFLVVAFILTNAAFACLFLLDADAIAGPHPPGFFDAFSFSVQTFATIGYGVMAPGTAYADLLVAVEAAVGILGAALATGLMLAKASRPVARVLFSNVLVVTRWDGRPTLLFRVGNARGNEIMEATINVSILRDVITPEGHHIRQLVDLPLERSRTPIFAMTWTVRHAIDEHSPLAGIDWDDPGDHLAGIIATLMGHDGTYSQTVQARHVWGPEDVQPNARFVDIVSQMPDGRFVIDYAQFHHVVPDDSAVQEAAAS
ncbi:MAG: low temperature requirement protein A [Alphaproteobacteria bacterium]|nr:low temperature requirement protein A [Alphaproteobacteria bacterium]